MRIPDLAEWNVLVDKVLYPMGIIIPDRTKRNVLIVKHLYPGQTGKIIWDGYTHWRNGHFQLGWVYKRALNTIDWQKAI